MANSCYNHIMIKGSGLEIQNFISLLVPDGAAEDNFPFLNLVSVFNRQNQDGSWFEIEIEKVDNENLILSGDSSWSPCLNIFALVSQKFSSFSIRYEYDEMGSNFAGWADIENGVIEDNSFDYWEGMIHLKGEEQALKDVIGNELDSYDTFDDLMDSDMYKAFNEASQNEILESFVEI